MAPLFTTSGWCVRCISIYWGYGVLSPRVLFDNLYERDDVTGGSQAITSTSFSGLR